LCLVSTTAREVVVAAAIVVMDEDITIDGRNDGRSKPQPHNYFSLNKIFL
jgi:hypothetical protein